MRIFCIGRNYSEHAKELNNDIPDEPIVFMKPFESLVKDNETIKFPSHGKVLQHELEVVIQIAQSGHANTEVQARAMIGSLALGLDLTLRDVQNELKAKGLPWEKAKSFEHSATVSKFVPYEASLDLAEIEFTCRVNNELRQIGHTRQMLFSFEQIILYLSSIWQLQTGDLIYTGTPSGVGTLQVGDQIVASSPQLGNFTWTMAA